MKTILLVLLFAAPVSAQGWYQYSYGPNGQWSYQWGYNTYYYQPRPVLYYQFGGGPRANIFPPYPYELRNADYGCYGNQYWTYGGR